MNNIVSGSGTITIVRGPAPNEVIWCAHHTLGFGAVNCDSIEPYYESHEQGAVPWLRIVKDGKVIARVNAQHLEEIRYD